MRPELLEFLGRLFQQTLCLLIKLLLNILKLCIFDLELEMIKVEIHLAQVYLGVPFGIFK